MSKIDVHIIFQDSAIVSKKRRFSRTPKYSYEICFRLAQLAVFMILFCLTHGLVVGAENVQPDWIASSNAFEAEIEQAKFNGIYSEYGVDSDGDGLFESLTIKLGINVLSSGFFTISGSLFGINGSEIANTSTGDYTSFGSKIVLLNFYGLKPSERYSIRNLTLFDVHGNLLDYKNEAYVSRKTYTCVKYFIPAKATLTGDYVDRCNDINHDGFCDIVTVDIGVYVQTPGEYNLMVDLCDINGSDISWSMVHKNLTSGHHVLSINFDGKSIGIHGVNGPYHLRDLLLVAGSSYSDLTICDYAFEPYPTFAYNYSDFIGSIHP